MAGKPAARIGDSVVQGVITTGSATVLIGTQGGVACSTCPGGMAVGHPVNPSLGAKVLGGAEDLDFALPGALPLIWQRQYSSYVNPEHGGACGLLGYGWTLPFEMSLQLDADATLMWDANGRAITFADALEPGGSLFSSSEDLYLARGSRQPCSWQDEARFADVPAHWRQNDDSLIVTSGDGQMLWLFQPVHSAFWAAPRWLLHAKRDRFGREQQFAYSTVHHRQPDAPEGEPLLTFPWPLLTRITDGCGRVFSLEYTALHAGAWDAPSVTKQHDKGRFFPHQASTDGYQGQAGWQPDSGWRLQQIQVLELDGTRQSLVRYDYSGQGDLIEVRDRHDRPTRRFAYKNHLLFAHQHMQGPEHVYTYEADQPGARVLEQRNEQELHYQFIYETHPAAPDDPKRSQTRVRDNLNREDLYEFAGTGGLKRLVRHQRADGSCLAYEYDAAGRLTGQTDPLGRTTWLRRDAEGRLLGINSPTAADVSLRYNPQGQLIERRQGQQTTRYVYDGWQRLIQITYPDGSTQQYQYADLMAAQPNTDQPSLLTADHPIRIEDPQGGIKQLQWSRTGQLLSHTDCSQRTTRYQYDRDGQLLAVQLADDTSLRYHYNALQQLERIRYADGSGEQYQYDPRGRLVCITPLDTQQRPVTGQHINLDYDLWNRVIRRSHAGTSTQFAYDIRGLLSELINENAARSQFEWDVMDRLVKETGFDGRTQHYHYNALGLLTTQDDGQNGQQQRIQYVYDDKDNLIQHRWGSSDALQTDTSPPFEQRFAWDGQRRLMQAQQYQGHGEQAQLLSECLFDYSATGQLAAETQRVWQADNNPAQPELLHEYHIEHQYDALGYRIQSLLPDVGQLGVLRYGSGHVQGIALNQNGLIDIRRDALHQEVERRWETDNNEHAIIRQQHWDALGRLQQRNYQNLPANLDRTPQTSHPEHNSAQEQDLLLNLGQRHYHYDALGQLTHIQQPKQIQYYAYDAHGRLTAARLGDEETARQNWRFDAAGNPLPPAHAPQPTPQDWTETVRQRWQEPDFNLIQPDTQAPAAQAHCWPDNRVGFSEHERYQYDAQGNRTESHNTKTGDIRHYTYNALNQLVQLDHYKQNNQLERSTYKYDPLGRRLEKQVEHYQIEEQDQQQHLTATGQISTEYYGWDGDRLVFCNDQKQQWHYLYEPDSFTPMLLIRQDNKQAVNEGEQILKDNMVMFQDTLRQLPNGEAEEARQQMREHIITTLKQQGLWQEPGLPQEYYLYHCNHLGLPDALTDQDGNIAWAAEYDPWGNVQNEHNPHQLKQAIRLPGQYHDPETGLYYNRHRYYDPALGSYINQDPIGLDSGEPNFYAYPTNPVQGADPLGLYQDPRIAMAQRAAGLDPNRKEPIVEAVVSYSKRVWGQLTDGVSGTGSAGGTIVAGVGISTSAGAGADSNGNMCLVTQQCILGGPMIGATTDGSLTGSTGTLNEGDTSYSLSGVGKFAVILGLGLEGGASDSGSLHAEGSKSMGVIAGGALKVCRQQVLKCTR